MRAGIADTPGANLLGMIRFLWCTSAAFIAAHRTFGFLDESGLFLLACVKWLSMAIVIRTLWLAVEPPLLRIQDATRRKANSQAVFVGPPQSETMTPNLIRVSEPLAGASFTIDHDLSTSRRASDSRGGWELHTGRAASRRARERPERVLRSFSAPSSRCVRDPRPLIASL